MTSLVKEINDDQFDEEIMRSTIPVLVDFWAEWCGPCKMLTPILDQVAEKLEGKLKIVKVNIDNNQDAPSKLGVRSIPALFLFNNGVEVDSKIGLSQANDLIDWINSKIS